MLGNTNGTVTYCNTPEVTQLLRVTIQWDFLGWKSAPKPTQYALWKWRWYMFKLLKRDWKLAQPYRPWPSLYCKIPYWMASASRFSSWKSDSILLYCQCVTSSCPKKVRVSPRRKDTSQPLHLSLSPSSCSVGRTSIIASQLKFWCRSRAWSIFRQWEGGASEQLVWCREGERGAGFSFTLQYNLWSCIRGGLGSWAAIQKTQSSFDAAIFRLRLWTVGGPIIGLIGKFIYASFSNGISNWFWGKFFRRKKPIELPPCLHGLSSRSCNASKPKGPLFGCPVQIPWIHPYNPPPMEMRNFS